jgi:hypothetical protein
MAIKNFVEEHNSDQVEPTAKGCAEFDWDEVERAFRDEPLTRRDAHKLAFALSFILDWLLKVDLNNHHALKSIGKRTISMAWVLDPERFTTGEGDEIEVASLRSLAKQLGFSAPNISPTTAEFSRLLKIFNQFQDHDWRNKKHEDHDHTKHEVSIEEIENENQHRQQH